MVDIVHAGPVRIRHLAVARSGRTGVCSQSKRSAIVHSGYPIVQTDHWSKRALDFLTAYLDTAQHTVRIATGYFSIPGYDRIRRHLLAQQTFILIGFDEDAHERLRERLLESICEELSRWEVANRRAAVLDLVGKLRRGELRILEALPDTQVGTRLRRGDHAKVYIIDDRFALVGSVNLSLSGLLTNSEGLSVVDHPDRVAYWLEHFEHYWHAPDTQDVTQALIAILEAWLDLATPYAVYLRTLRELLNLRKIDPPRPTYKLPVRYQQVIVERLLRQLSEHRGAMLVASTGLGKTVMATHTALWLAQRGLIHNVLVFAPRAIHVEWEQQFRDAGVSCVVLTRELLDRPATTRQLSASSRQWRMEETLASVDGRYLIIVDESQYFRHRTRAKDGDPRHSFRRLMPVIEEHRPFVLLLTATPYSRDIADVNSQLSLLPHTAPPDYRNTSGQYAMPGVIDVYLQPQAWRVREAAQYFQEFINLPVTTVISTSQVARDFATPTEHGDFIDFHGTPRWVPQIAVHRVRTPVPEEAAMRAALMERVFEHKPLRYRTRERGGVTRDNVQQQAQLAWASSPAALREVVEKTITDEYDVDFIVSPARRQQVLGPILERLRTLPASQDAKLQALCQLVQQGRAEMRKTLIFTERHATAVYLAEQLPLAIPGLRVAATSQRDSSGSYSLRNFEKEVLTLIYGFAPVANEDKLRHRRNRPDSLDVLVVTDAFSAGVNLQDASMVVNYDLAWTPDVLTQRAGRIFRFWHEARLVKLYFFLGTYTTEHEFAAQGAAVESRLARLTERDRGARRFSGLPGLPEEESAEYKRLGNLASLDATYLGLANLGELGEFDAISPLLRHSGVLQRERDVADALADDLTSALVYGGQKPLVYLLLGHPDGYSWSVVDMDTLTPRSYTEDQLLGLIACRPETPTAEIAPDRIEEAAQQARDLWMQQHPHYRPEQVKRICALYLQPRTRAAEISAVLGESLRGT